MTSKIKKIIFMAMQKAEKMYKTIIFSLMIATTTVSQSYAATPKLVTGTVALFKAASGWLLLIIPVGAGLFVGFHAIQKALTDDQAVIAEKNKLMKNTLIGAAIAETADGLVAIILAFYQ